MCRQVIFLTCLPTQFFFLPCEQAIFLCRPVISEAKMACKIMRNPKRLVYTKNNLFVIAIDTRGSTSGKWHKMARGRASRRPALTSAVVVQVNDAAQPPSPAPAGSAGVAAMVMGATTAHGPRTAPPAWLFFCLPISYRRMPPCYSATAALKGPAFFFLNQQTFGHGPASRPLWAFGTALLTAAGPPPSFLDQPSYHRSTLLGRLGGG